MQQPRADQPAALQLRGEAAGDRGVLQGGVQHLQAQQGEVHEAELLEEPGGAREGEGKQKQEYAQREGEGNLQETLQHHRPVHGRRVQQDTETQRTTHHLFLTHQEVTHPPLRIAEKELELASAYSIKMAQF